MGTYPYDRNISWDESAWETKIVRARNREFGQRDHLEALLHQEQFAGWIMTDKYNDSTVRFIRPRTMRARDRYLPRGIDPYRTVYIPEDDPDTQVWFMIMMGIAVVACIVGITLVVVIATFHT